MLPLAWLVHLGEHLFQRLRRPQYTLSGRCHARGNCCHHILAELPGVVGGRNPFRALSLLWATEFHGFFLRSFSAELDDGSHAQVFGCRYLQPNGRCAHYWLRPMVCRLYPHSSSHAPSLLEGCGYHLARPPVQSPRLPVVD